MSRDALELLLSGVKDQAQRKQITSAYYAFASGDPETFAVQFAVLLRAHSMSLKLLPARLEKALAAETRRMSDLVIAHHNAIGRMASLIDQAGSKNGVGEGTETCLKTQRAIEHQLSANAEILRSEREKIISAVTANGRLTQRLAAQRILLTVILSFIGGVLTTLVCEEFLSLVEPLLR
jgi:hypothetical protein